MKCEICSEPNPGLGLMCINCQRSYDLSRKKDDGTLWSALFWAAGRARRAERKRLKNER